MMSRRIVYLLIGLLIIINSCIFQTTQIAQHSGQNQNAGQPPKLIQKLNEYGIVRVGDTMRYIGDCGKINFYHYAYRESVFKTILIDSIYKIDDSIKIQYYVNDSIRVDTGYPGSFGFRDSRVASYITSEKYLFIDYGSKYLVEHDSVLSMNRDELIRLNSIPKTIQDSQKLEVINYLFISGGSGLNYPSFPLFRFWNIGGDTLSENFGNEIVNYGSFQIAIATTIIPSVHYYQYNLKISKKHGMVEYKGDQSTRYNGVQKCLVRRIF